MKPEKLVNKYANTNFWQDAILYDSIVVNKEQLDVQCIRSTLWLGLRTTEKTNVS